MTTEMLRNGLELIPYKDRLRELGFFTLKRWCTGDLTKAFQYKVIKLDSGTVINGRWMRENGHELKEERS